MNVQGPIFMHLCIHACAAMVPRRVLVFIRFIVSTESERERENLWYVYAYTAEALCSLLPARREPTGPQLSRHYAL